jgi:hypothetical protein
MRWPLQLLVLMIGLVACTVPAGAQLSGGTPDLPITAPSLPALETPGLSTDYLQSLQGLGPKPAGEILKSLDKDLGRSSGLDLGEYSRDRPMEGPRYRPDEDLEKDPAAHSKF